MPEDVAFELVQLVIKNGKISNDGKQYCYATTFESGYVVYTDLTKTGTHVFNIYKDWNDARFNTAFCHYEIACKRIEQAVAQGQLFPPEQPTQEQKELLWPSSNS